jgi:hypothetical protein
MHRIIALGLCLWLGGCGLSSQVMKVDSLAFGDVIEDTTNKLLVLNVLRARDKAPLHFADIPVIRESMQQSATFSGINFSGPITGTTSRNNRTAGLGVQFTPSFELTHLYSKEFHTGIATPIDPKFVKYWLDRGLDRRIVLLLFFSAAEIVETRSENEPVTTVRIMNSPRDAVDIITRRTQVGAVPEEQRCDMQSDFERYLKLINALKTFFAHSYRERRALATGINLEAEKDSRMLQSFASLDQNKGQLVYDRGTRAYNLYALSPDPKVAFCLSQRVSASGRGPADFEMIGGANPAMLPSKQNCFRPVVELPAEDSSKPPTGESPLTFEGVATRSAPSRYCEIYNRFLGMSQDRSSSEYPKVELRLHLRSVGEIFQFLGDLLHYQDELQRHIERRPEAAMKLNTPVTFGYCGDDPTAGCEDVFLRLDGEACNARFSLSYRDREYHVGNFTGSGENACGSRPTSGRDHTLEILAVLHQLVGLHRSAADIRQTPTVQVLP